MAQSLIGSLRVSLGLDSAQFNKGIKTATDKLRDTGKQMRNIGAGMSVAVTAPLILAAKDAVAAFNTQDAAMAKVRQGVESTGGAAGKTADELFSMAQALQGVTAFGDEEVLNKVTAQLLTFTNIAGEQFEKAQVAALDLATVLDGDLQSASIQLGKALNDPVANLSALSRSGIQFSEDQKEVIKTFAETGRLAEAQSIILDEIAKQYGGQAAAAADTFGGKTQQLANTWGDLKEEFGAILADILPPLIDLMRDVVKWLQDLDPATKEWGVKLGILAAVIGPLVGTIGLFVVGISAISLPVLAVVAGVAALTAGLIAFWPEIVAAKDAVIQFGKDGLEYIKGLPAEIVAAFKNLPSLMLEIGGDIMSGLRQGISDKVDSVKDAISGAATGMVDGIKGKLGIKSPSRVFREIGQFTMEGLGLGIEDGAIGMRDTAGAIIDDLKSDFKGMFSSILTQGASFKEAFANLLGSIGNRLISTGLDSLFSMIPGFAMGTNYAPGGLAMVGERGPELVNLPRGSQVIPNHKLPNGGGGRSEIVLHAPEGFSAQQIGQIEGVSVRVVQTGLKQYSDNAFPRMQEKVRNDPRVRG